MAAQAPLLVGPNQYAFQFSGGSGPTLYGEYFNSTNVRFEYRSGAGVPVMHLGADNGDLWVYGNLNLHTGSLLVGPDRYAFRYQGSNGVITNYGLVFSNTTSSYEFKDSNTANLFSLHAVTGNTYIKGDLQVEGLSGADTRMVVTDASGNLSTQSMGGGSGLWSQDGTTAYYTAGSVSIGTATPATGYELSVDGKIICEQLHVKLSDSWPDYVFADDYELMPLEELKAQIKQNKHLPNIPPAKVMEAEGISVGEMQRKMMEKIEELTLYVIEQNDQLTEQQTEMNMLKKQIELLEEQNELLRQQMNK